MGQSAEYIRKALKTINDNREKQIIIANNKKELIYIQNPELKAIDASIASVFQQAMRETFAGKKPNFAKAEQESSELLRKKEKIIRENNIEKNFLLPEFECKDCEDTGYKQGRLCDCVRRKATRLIYDELNKDVPLGDSTFEKFDLDFYSDKPGVDGVVPKDIMTKICNFCVKYANDFTIKSDSLMFFGKTGLGKTHLSLSIANEVIKKGYNVVYGPISKIIGNIEKEHFSSAKTENITLDNVINCDLLIFDDLGTEFSTQFVVSTVFEIINSRILNQKPTIINTNLDIDELKAKYSERIVSRIAGCYRLFQFYGEDIRIIK